MEEGALSAMKNLPCPPYIPDNPGFVLELNPIASRLIYPLLGPKKPRVKTLTKILVT